MKNTCTKLQKQNFMLNLMVSRNELVRAQWCGVLLLGECFFHFFQLVIGGDPLLRLLIIAILFHIFLQRFKCY